MTTMDDPEEKARCLLVEAGVYFHAAAYMDGTIYFYWVGPGPNRKDLDRVAELGAKRGLPPFKFVEGCTVDGGGVLPEPVPISEETRVDLMRRSGPEFAPSQPPNDEQKENESVPRAHQIEPAL